jgi:hypothetical protein
VKAKSTILASAWLVVCACLAALKTDAQEILVATTARTNLDAKTVHATNTFTRSGMTNLVVRTLTKGDIVQARIQRVYREGILLGEIDDDEENGVFGMSAEPNRPYALAFQFKKDKSLQSVVVGSNGVILDAFECTNGVLYPMTSDKIQKANDSAAGLKDLLDPKNVRGKSP